MKVLLFLLLLSCSIDCHKQQFAKDLTNGMTVQQLTVLKKVLEINSELNLCWYDQLFNKDELDDKSKQVLSIRITTLTTQLYKFIDEQDSKEQEELYKIGKKLIKYTANQEIKITEAVLAEIDLKLTGSH